MLYTNSTIPKCTPGKMVINRIWLIKPYDGPWRRVRLDRPMMHCICVLPSPSFFTFLSSSEASSRPTYVILLSSVLAPVILASNPQNLTIRHEHFVLFFKNGKLQSTVNSTGILNNPLFSTTYNSNK